MALDRTWYNTLVDDSGSNLDGTIWNKAAVDSLMDAVDASLLSPLNVSLSNAAQVIANTTFTVLTFSTESFDVGGLHSTVTNTGRITIPTGGDGLWLVSGVVQFFGNATGAQRTLRLLKGGVEQLRDQYAPTAAVQSFLKVQALVVAVATNYFELDVYQDSGGNLNTDATGATTTKFMAARISA